MMNLLCILAILHFILCCLYVYMLMGLWLIVLNKYQYQYYLNVGMNENLRNNEIPLRKSRDLVLDNYGRRLLDLCKPTDLLIANGRLGDDAKTLANLPV